MPSSRQSGTVWLDQDTNRPEDTQYRSTQDREEGQYSKRLGRNPESEAEDACKECRETSHLYPAKCVAQETGHCTTSARLVILTYKLAWIIK
jgi:hypothetical protein